MQGLQLHVAPRHQIVMQRGEVARLDGLRQRQGALLGGLRHRVAVRLGHRAYLGNQAAERRPCSVCGADLPDRQPHRGRHAGLRADEGELGPQHGLNARRQLRPESGLLAARQQALRPLAGVAVEFPEGDAGRSAGVQDHPRLGDLNKDEGSSAHHVVFPDLPSELFFVLDPVLQRYDGRVLAHQWSQPGRGGVGVEGLDAKQHEVARTDISRVIGGGRLRLEVALHAAHPQSMLAKCLQVGTPRYEVHLCSGLGEPPAEIATDPAGRINSDTHVPPPLRPHSRYRHATPGH